MRVKFWGVRGSIPAPLTPSAVREKIAGAIKRVRTADLASAGAREEFLSRLPSWLSGFAGGNTACIEVSLNSGEVILLDGGSGLREYGASPEFAAAFPGVFHIFFSHFHWDHLQGIPFFPPLYRQDAVLKFYSPAAGLRNMLKLQMKEPFFPVNFEGLSGARTFFVRLKKSPCVVGGAEIAWKKMNHPGGCYAYRISEGGRSIIYATDSELMEGDFERSAENTAFFQDADMIILDAQYTLGEAVKKFNWGHSSFSLAVDFASAWNIKNLWLFHHDPSYDDRKLDLNLHTARGYYRHLGKSGMKIFLAEEGKEVYF
ncbi:MAG: MBL fold metallo-hydrolase [Spirochaetales bacterium]|jgi:phosphoribosyl 1,2-cyclic phosphodiesterase|nr:MBL fold metallo-hydrolase [Spirochaetales bacterium]